MALVRWVLWWLLHGVLPRSARTHATRERNPLPWRHWWSPAGRPLWRTHENGTLVMPPSTRKVLIDVGTSLESQFMEHARTSSDIFVIGFEPLPDVAGSHPGLARLLVVPAAVGPASGASGQRPLYTFTGLDSRFSSFLPLREGRQANITAHGRAVPVVTLEEAIQRIPPHVHVAFVKVDAQGFDLQVILSAGEQLRRVARIQAECQDLPRDHRDLIYADQPTKSDVVSAMRSRGYVLERCWDNNPRIREQNCVFARSDVVLDVHGTCFEELLRRRSWYELAKRLAPLLALPTKLQRTALANPSNMARLLELWCCQASAIGVHEPHRSCFNEAYTKDRCCLRAYLEHLDYFRDWRLFQLERAWSPNGSMVHLTWST